MRRGFVTNETRQTFEILHADETLLQSERSREAVAVKKKLLKGCYGEVERDFVVKKIRAIERYLVYQNTKKSWDQVNEVTQRKKANCGLIEEGSATERLKNWEHRFVKLLGQPPKVPDEDIVIRTINPPLDINIIHLFTDSNLNLARKQIKERKAFGEDRISLEVMKRVGRVDLNDIVLKFCNDLPDQWKMSLIIPVPKRGDLTKTDSYRGIAPTSIISKTIMHRMILNRMKPSLERVLYSC